MNGEAKQSNAQPLFRLTTAHLRPGDQPSARSLGEALFDRFNRDSNNPLDYGLGIPVAIDVPLNWLDSLKSSDRAVRTLMVIVAGTDSILLASRQSIELLNRLADPDGAAAQMGLRLLLAPTDHRWLRESRRLRSLTVCEPLSATSDNRFDTVSNSVIDCIVLEVSRQLDQLQQQAAGPDFVASGKTADAFATVERSESSPPVRPWLLLPGSIERIGDRRLEPYFDEVLEATDDLINKATVRRPRLSTVLAVMDEVSLDRRAIIEQQRSLADQHGWPTVMIDRRQLNAATGYQEVLRRAAIEHLRQRHFLLQADRICQTAGLPINTAILPREPKLIDLAGGMLRGRGSGLVIHPDPMLTPRKRQVLRSVQPRLRLATPSTLLGRGQRKADDLTLQTPLDGVDVGLSISVMDDHDFTAGNTYLHLENTAVQVVRMLLSGGCRISYGGSFVVGGKTSFNPILANLVESYHETANQSTDLLKIYLAADEKLASVPSEIRCHVRHLALSEDLRADPIFGPDHRDHLPSGMLHSEMRIVMTREVTARVAIGGKLHPKQSDEDGRGYSGRFPGVAEEVFRAITNRQPVYVCGGFGGVSGKICKLLEHPEHLDDYWLDASDDGNARFTELRVEVDRHPLRHKLDLPPSRETLARRIAEEAEHLGDDDDLWLESNGLSREQNELLWHSTDPTLISSLIAEGLIRWRQRSVDSIGRMIELMHGDIVMLPAVDLIAIPVFDDVEPQGAGAAVDRATGGLLRRAATSPGRLIGIGRNDLDADYLTALSIGRLSELAKNADSAVSRLTPKIRDAARQLARLCTTEGLVSVGLVTFGGSTSPNYEQAITAMMEGLNQSRESLIIRWAEYDAVLFERLRMHLERRNDVRVTTIVRPTEPQLTRQYPWYNLSVTWDADAEQLSVTGLGRNATAQVYSRTASLTEKELTDFSTGEGWNERTTPDQDELSRRGRKLAELLFGKETEQFLERCADVPLAIVHDEPSSKLPFELLRFGNSSSDIVPSLRAGIHRWLAAEDAPLEGSFATINPSPILRVGLVIDPDASLDGAREEGRKIREVLAAMGGKVRLTCLGDQSPPATRKSVMELLTRVDVLHYCGHAGFDPEHRDRSALKLHDGKLTGQDLAKLPLVPRVVILNACEAGRVRAGDPEQPIQSPAGQAHSLAQTIIAAGVEAFVGTLWEVRDEAAKRFAAKLYESLLAHQSLRDSVTAGRRQLAAQNQQDWGNYLLYGDGQFQLP